MEFCQHVVLFIVLICQYNTFVLKRQEIKPKILTIVLEFRVSQTALDPARGMPVRQGTRSRRLSRGVCLVF